MVPGLRQAIDPKGDLRETVVWPLRHRLSDKLHIPRRRGQSWPALQTVFETERVSRASSYLGGQLRGQSLQRLARPNPSGAGGSSIRGNQSIFPGRERREPSKESNMLGRETNTLIHFQRIKKSHSLTGYSASVNATIRNTMKTTALIVCRMLHSTRNRFGNFVAWLRESICQVSAQRYAYKNEQSIFYWRQLSDV